MSPLEAMVADTLWHINTFGVHWDMAAKLVSSHKEATPERLDVFYQLAEETRQELDTIGPLGCQLGESMLVKVRQQGGA